MKGNSPAARVRPPGRTGATSPILVAAFEPFLGRKRNRSWEVVRRMCAVPGMERILLPVDFSALAAAIGALLDRHPRALLLVGEASRKRVTVERVALNVADSDDPDNRGRTPRDQPLVPGGALALRSPWDARAVAETLTEHGSPAAASFHAGTFACNAALYLALHRAEGETAVGLLHVPRRRWPRGPRSSRLVRGAELALSALLLSTDPRLPPPPPPRTVGMPPPP